MQVIGARQSTEMAALCCSDGIVSYSSEMSALNPCDVVCQSSAIEVEDQQEKLSKVCLH